MTRTSDFNGNGNDLRALNDIELEQVSGGFINDGGCIHLPTIGPAQPPAPGSFKDVFAKYTIGR